MSQFNLDRTVGQLVAERPSRSRIFEQFGIDYCCGGKKPLEEACRDRQLPVSQVVAALTAADQAPAGDEIDWTRRPMGELADHIVGTHHVYLKHELPRLEYLVRRVLTAHGANHPELSQVEQVFAGLRQELESHMMKEERVLFPMIKQLEHSSVLPDFHCGSVGAPITVMEYEHDNAGQALAHLRTLTRDYTPPPDICNTYRAMLSGLAELETDMHRHIHKENNILFPAAAARERELRELSHTPN